MLKHKPFTRTKLDEEKRRDTFTVSLNDEERSQLEDCKKVLNQEKDSTAIKQLASIGAKVIHNPETLELLSIVLDNKRRNKRLGINYFD